MKSWLHSFNIYLWLALLVAVSGCGSMGRLSGKKEYSTLRVYLQSSGGASSGGNTVLVTRDKIPVSVEAEPFLTEADLAKATLVDNADGTYAIKVECNDHGKLVLDMTTTSNKGRRLVIFSQWPPPGWKEPKNQKEANAAKKAEEDPSKPRMKGWLSVVPNRNGMPGGWFEFTPDASHAEAERIVRGLNNMVHEIDKE